METVTPPVNAEAAGAVIDRQRAAGGHCAGKADGSRGDVTDLRSGGDAGIDGDGLGIRGVARVAGEIENEVEVIENRSRAKRARGSGSPGLPTCRTPPVIVSVPVQPVLVPVR